jgi:hypothetical protein
MDYNINVGNANTTIIIKNGIQVDESTILRWSKEISSREDIVILKK